MYLICSFSGFCIQFPVYLCRSEAGEVESLKAHAMPLSAVDKNHLEHQIQLTKQDVANKLQQFDSHIHRQSLLAGHTVADEQIETMKLELHSMAEDCGKLSDRLEVHEELCAQVQSKQVSYSIEQVSYSIEQVSYSIEQVSYSIEQVSYSIEQVSYSIEQVSYSID